MQYKGIKEDLEWSRLGKVGKAAHTKLNNLPWHGLAWIDLREYKDLQKMKRKKRYF